MESSRRQVIAGLTARVLAVLAVLLLLGFGSVEAVRHHRAAAPPTANTDAAYRVLGARLREIRTMMLGTTLPPLEVNCARMADLTQQRLGYAIPQRGSRGWQIMIDSCTKSVR